MTPMQFCFFLFFFRAIITQINCIKICRCGLHTVQSNWSSNIRYVQLDSWVEIILPVTMNLKLAAHIYTNILYIFLSGRYTIIVCSSREKYLEAKMNNRKVVLWFVYTKSLLLKGVWTTPKVIKPSVIWRYVRRDVWACVWVCLFLFFHCFVSQLTYVFFLFYDEDFVQMSFWILNENVDLHKRRKKNRSLESFELVKEKKIQAYMMSGGKISKTLT